MRQVIHKYPMPGHIGPQISPTACVGSTSAQRIEPAIGPSAAEGIFWAIVIALGSAYLFLLWFSLTVRGRRNEH